VVTAILRIDPRSPSESNGAKGLGDYTIPPGNPFAGDNDPATLGEIYAYGFRNAHRLSWDLTDGTMFAATLDLIETLDLRDLVLVGVSIGGWVAAEVATKTTERIKKLVLVNPAGIKTGGPTHRDMVDIFALPQKELEAAAFHDTAHARFDPKVASEDEVYVRLRNRETTVLVSWSPYMYNPKLLGRLHRIKVPTLVLWGASDKIAPADYGRAYARAIPGATFELIEKAGRFPHIEQPQEFAKRVAAFAA
jgi:pimeloyl-ACP methyl ester carboxylesterase